MGALWRSYSSEDPKGPEAMSRVHVEKVAVAIVYLASSVVTTVVNKYAMSVLGTQAPFMFLASQSAIISAMMVGCRALGILRFRLGGAMVFYRWLPLSTCLALMIYTGSRGVEYLPVSTFTVLKNGTIVLNAVAEKHLFGKGIAPWSWVSFALMFASSYMGDASEFDVSVFGYVWMALNIVSTSLYVLLMKMHIEHGKSRAAPVFYCNLLSLPQLVLCSLAFDYRSGGLGNVDGRLAAATVASGVSAFLTSHATAWCLSLLSTTSLSMLGALNKLIVSFSGIFFIGERNIGPAKLASLMVGFVAGLMYSASAGSG
ncbi:UNVERIFIED_CONTAM: hypothetical protein PYX00_011492 [Menopon gallinae]|uniref:GDP-mannose transporter n=1 Tax=Menopon gallinae TaxID=328185 RepID=A0AAW2H7T8_9NEOP